VANSSKKVVVPVQSVFGRIGAVVAQSGDYSTSLVTEGSNLYYTQARFDTAFSAKNTSNLTEGGNLYYTQGRFDSAFAAKSTSNLSEGSNLYYTQARFDTALAAKSTSNISEGSNLYFTNARAISALSGTLAGYALLTGATFSGAISASNLSGTNTGDQLITLTGDVTGSGTGTFAATLSNSGVTAGAYTSANITVDAKGRITVAANGSGGGGTPAGSSGDLQFNNAGAFGGEATLALSRGGPALPNTQTTIATVGTITAQAVASTFLEFTGAATKTIQGMVAPASGNYRVTLRNLGAGGLIIANQNAGATAANRFELESGKDLTIVSGATSEFIYNTTSSRWNVKEIRNQVANDTGNNLFSINAGVLTSGVSNILIGHRAAITTGLIGGGFNVIMGYEAAKNTTGFLSNNVIIGNSAGRDITNTSPGNGSNNVIIGSTAAQLITTGYSCIAIGDNSSPSMTTGRGNIGIGSGSNNSVTTGGFNIGIGLNSGVNYGTGVDNISIGTSTGCNTSNVSGTLVIGASARVQSSDQGNIAVSGNLGISVTNPQYKLDVSGDVNAGGIFRIGGLPFNPWLISGNSGTSPGTDFLGTTDFQAMVIKTFALERGRVTENGLFGFQKTAPDSSVHVGSYTVTPILITSCNAVIGAILATGGYAFASGNKNYEAYSKQTINGTDIFAATPATTTFTEPASTVYDVIAGTANEQVGTGYDPNVDTPPAYQIWALYVTDTAQSITPLALTLNGTGAWIDFSNNQDVLISWTQPTGLAPTSYFIVRNATDYKTTTSLSVLDDNTAWTVGTSPGLPNITYDVFFSCTFPTGISATRTLNTTTGTFVDSATPSFTDDSTWAAGSTVTPTSYTYDSLHIDGKSLFSEEVTIAEAKNVKLGTTTGTIIATDVSQKLAFHNSTPVVQRSGAAQDAVATTAATNVAPYGFTTAAQADAMVTLVNEIRAALVEKGIIKGGA